MEWLKNRQVGVQMPERVDIRKCTTRGPRCTNVKGDAKSRQGQSRIMPCVWSLGKQCDEYLMCTMKRCHRELHFGHVRAKEIHSFLPCWHYTLNVLDFSSWVVKLTNLKSKILILWGQNNDRPILILPFVTKNVQKSWLNSKFWKQHDFSNEFQSGFLEKASMETAQIKLST